MTLRAYFHHELWNRCLICEGEEYTLTDEFDFIGSNNEATPVQELIPCPKCASGVLSAAYAALRKGYNPFSVLVRKKHT